VSINSVLPALIAGNAVIFKPSPQTPLTAERFALALTRAGVPADAIQVIHMSSKLATHAIQNVKVNLVSFTGSVVGGHAVEKAAIEAPGFTSVALEVRLCVRIVIYETEYPTAWRKRSCICARGRRYYLHRDGASRRFVLSQSLFPYESKHITP
jgi:hypothetical protein